MSYTAAIIAASDKGGRGAHVDTSGPAVCAVLREADCAQAEQPSGKAPPSMDAWLKEKCVTETELH